MIKDGGRVDTCMVDIGGTIYRVWTLAIALVAVAGPGSMKGDTISEQHTNLHKVRRELGKCIMKSQDNSGGNPM